MRFIIAVFMMINFFFQRYTTTLITLETSYSFSGQIILTVLQDISPSNHLILNVLFSRTKSQFLGEKFSGFAIIALFHILQMYLFAFSLMSWKYSGNELLPITFTKEMTTPVVFGLYSKSIIHGI